MSKFSAFFLLLAIVFAVPASCYSLPESRQAIVNHAMNMMMNCEFDAARSLCDSLSAADSADPMDDMLKLSVLGFSDLDCNHVSDSVVFVNQLSKTERTVFVYEAHHGVSSYSLTVKGFAKAIAACYFLWHKGYIKGLNTGFDALGVLKEAKKMDPANCDVDLFLGLYNYARADMKRMFWWAFFWYPGDKESGMQSLMLCKRNGLFAQSVATLVLAELSIREKKFPEAETIISGLCRDFPQSRLVRWTHAKCFEEQNRPQQAAELYEGLANEYDSIPSAWRNALAARLKEASLWQCFGDRTRAAEECKKIVLKKKDHQDPVSRQIVKDAEKLLETIRKSS